MAVSSIALVFAVITASVSGCHFDDEAEDPLYDFSEYEAVPQHRHDRLKEIHADFRMERQFSEVQDEVAQLIEFVNEESLRSILNTLTSFTTRQSQSVNAPSGVIQATNFAQQLMRNYGFTSELDTFRNGWGPNVISERRGTTRPDEIIVIGAHLDDRNVNVNDQTGRAPGANDDGSGSAAMFEIARIMQAANVSLEATLRIGLWGGEEQGLVGSRAYAAACRARGDNVIAMLQADMIGYRNSSQFRLPTLHLVSRNVDLPLTEFVDDVVSRYVPSSQLTIGRTTACCSDHQSFLENGFASAGFVEGGGYTIDPQYHRIGDAMDRSGYDITQIALHTKGMLANIALLAGLQ